MQSTPFLASLALLAAAAASPSLAEESKSSPPHERAQAANLQLPSGFDYGMKAVPHSAAPDAPGYGWRYFSDPVTRRAIVISPSGDYYLSRGKGLRWIAAEQT